MKKVAIITKKMVVGGIEKSLISMLNNFDYNKYDITLFLTYDGGVLLKDIPKNVKIKYILEEEKNTLDSVITRVKKCQFKMALYTLLKRINTDYFKESMYLCKSLPMNEIKYDIAIAYNTPGSFSALYTLNNIMATKKVAWIHSDISSFKNEFDKYILLYNGFNYIFCVSEYLKDRFIKLYPQFLTKTHVFRNIINYEEILELSNDKIDEIFNREYINLLSVGRLVEEKGQLIIPKVLDELKEEKKKVKWYIIGEGVLRDKLQREIEKYNCNNQIILLGEKKNPYPYIKSCDLFIQPSINEAFGLTIAEAKIFEKPIITTDTIGGIQQIRNNVNGLVVKYNHIEIANAIKKLMNNKELCNKIINNINCENKYKTNDFESFEKIIQY